MALPSGVATVFLLLNLSDIYTRHSFTAMSINHFAIAIGNWQLFSQFICGTEFDDGKVKLSCTPHDIGIVLDTSAVPLIVSGDIPKFIINRNQHQIQFIRRMYAVRT